MQFLNRDIRPLSESPRKVKTKKRSAGSLKGLLQDNGDDNNPTSVPGTLIIQRRLGFDDDEGTDTGNHLGGYLGRPPSAAKYNGKSGTPSLERLLQSEVTSDSPIISWFGEVYMLDSITLL